MTTIDASIDRRQVLQILDRLPLAMQYGLLAGLAAGMTCSPGEQQSDQKKQSTGQ